MYKTYLRRGEVLVIDSEVVLVIEGATRGTNVAIKAPDRSHTFTKASLYPPPPPKQPPPRRG